MLEPKRVKNRVHVDLRAIDVDVELDQLLSLGPRTAEPQPNPGLVVLPDPERNEFCLLRS